MQTEARTPDRSGASEGASAHEVKQAGRDAARAAVDAGREAREGAMEVRDAVTEGAREVAERAQARVGDLIEGQKDRLCDEVQALGRALGKAADDLGEEGFGNAATLARRGSSGLDRVARRLDERDLGGLAADAEDFGRSDPYAFLAGAMALGFVASRFFKAGADGARARRSSGGNGAAADLGAARRVPSRRGADAAMSADPMSSEPMPRS